jgi:hypothetical protein
MRLVKMEFEQSEKITRNEYVLTNIDLESLCFTIRLTDEKEYIVYHKKININGKNKTINYIKKDGKIILLDEEVTKWYLTEVRVYQKEGI